jgi:hypothetical protein
VLDDVHYGVVHHLLQQASYLHRLSMTTGRDDWDLILEGLLASQHNRVSLRSLYLKRSHSFATLTDSALTLLQNLQQLRLVGVSLACPALLVHGPGDKQLPLMQRLDLTGFDDMAVAIRHVSSACLINGNTHACYQTNGLNSVCLDDCPEHPLRKLVVAV